MQGAQRAPFCVESNGKSIFHAYWKENRQYDDNWLHFIVKPCMGWYDEYVIIQ
jgi:hypothetical protein